MKLSKFSKLAGFLSIAIIGSSLLTIGCSRFNNQSEEKTVEDKSKEKDSLIANMDSATVFERCKLYYSSENYTEAFKCFQKAAEQGNALAQCNLGFMYQYGRGVKQDYFKAFEWYQKAAEQGLAVAQFNLGVMFDNGKGVKQDYFKAVEWYQKAAEQGDAKAQYNLGNMYADGKGVKQDYAKAVELYQKAAEQGYAKAQFILGLIFFEGKNYSKAKEYFGLACDNKYQAGCDMYRKLNK